MNLANLAMSPDWVWLSLSAVTVFLLFRLFFAAVRLFVKAALTMVTLAILFYFASNYLKRNESAIQIPNPRLPAPWASEASRAVSQPL